MDERLKKVKTLTAQMYENIIIFLVNVLAYAFTLIDAIKQSEFKPLVIAVILSVIPVVIVGVRELIINEANGIKKIIYLILMPIGVIYMLIAMMLMYANAIMVAYYISIAMGIIPLAEAAFNIVDAVVELKAIR